MSDKNAAAIWPMFVGLGLLALAYHVGSKPVGTERVIKALAPIDYARQRIAVRKDKPLVTNRDAQAGANIQAMGYSPPPAAPSGTGSGYSTLGQDPSGL